VADFDAAKPSIARVYDHWLGGKDNFASDRDLGDRLMTVLPELPAMVRENREFLTRAVGWAAGQGVGQFIDLGCGLPTEPSTLDSARAAVPDARVVHVDNDPVVINHLIAELRTDPVAAVLDADAADAGAVLAAASEFIDLSRPACLVLGALVHFYGTDEARDLVASYTSALAPGSYVVLSAGCLRPGPDSQRVVEIYSAGPSPLHVHSPEDLVSFLVGLEVLPPGVADARAWRPGWDSVPDPAPRGVWMNAVMAQVPER
jgi:hypothetical protein